MSVQDQVSSMLLLMLLFRMLKSSWRVLKPSAVLVAKFVFGGALAIGVLIGVVFAASTLVSPQRDIGHFLPMNLTSTSVFASALLLCFLYISATVQVAFHAVLMPILKGGSLDLVPKGAEGMMDMRDRYA